MYLGVYYELISIQDRTINNSLFVSVVAILYVCTYKMSTYVHKYMV